MAKERGNQPEVEHRHTCTNEWAQAPTFLWCAVCGRTLTSEEAATVRRENPSDFDEKGTPDDLSP